MGDLINLRRARKRREKDNASNQADINRAKFGRTKQQRDNDAAEAAHVAEALDQHKLPGDAT